MRFGRPACLDQFIQPGGFADRKQPFREEGQAFGLALVLRGSEERLVPILMTAATAAFALLPLVLKGNVPGNEIERPMALVILGGLATSTLLNLFLLPALYARFGRKR